MSDETEIVACYKRLLVVAEEYREMGRDLPLFGASDQLAELSRLIDGSVQRNSGNSLRATSTPL